ncbi:hypothetical protein [Streptomyces sp. A5-4]|uniref:hypothetical protein n=1 Tax=Streptomyces sp. A5-4 TaxID=3384771 RepID=UPI003DA8372E
MTEDVAGELTGRQTGEQPFALLSDEPVDVPNGDLLDTGPTARRLAARERAERALGITDIGLVISDIQGGTDRTAGFDLLARRRSTGSYSRPAAFCASRITPNGQARAAELRAEVYRDGDELFSYVAGVAQARAWAQDTVR